MTTRIMKLSAAALGGVLALGACTSTDPSPAPSTSTSSGTPSTSATTPVAATSTTASSATTQAPAPPPKAATQRTEAGALAFVKHYMDIYNQTAVHPQAGQIAALSRAECKTCATQEQDQTYFLKHAQHYVSSPTRLDRVSSSPEAVASKNPYRVVADVTMFGVSIVDAKGKTVRTDPKQSGTYAFYLVWADNTWKVSKLKVVA